MRIAIHQPNFIPWFPYFQKMAQADLFVILTECQFAKNSWMNRCQVDGKWWTNPVEHGLVPIMDKHYTNGQSLVAVNLLWIKAIALTLGIDITKIRFDIPTDKKSTGRILEICQHYKADEYLTNMDAIEKYLDIKVMEGAGIKIIPFVSNYKKHVFEMFAEYGIEGTRKLVYEREESQEIEEGSSDNGKDRSGQYIAVKT